MIKSFGLRIIYCQSNMAEYRQVQINDPYIDNRVQHWAITPIVSCHFIIQQTNLCVNSLQVCRRNIFYQSYQKFNAKLSCHYYCHVYLSPSLEQLKIPNMASGNVFFPAIFLSQLLLVVTLCPTLIYDFYTYWCSFPLVFVLQFIIVMSYIYPGISPHGCYHGRGIHIILKVKRLGHFSSTKTVKQV